MKYEKAFKKAEYTFIYQRVFCPMEQKLVHLEGLPANMVDSDETRSLDFLGP